jgi:transketolase
MGLRVIYVLTHDSIGLGEDGPTHQPIEHLAALRAMPNINVFRPADGIEVAECWELALRSVRTPSILALTRQAVPQLRTATADHGLCAKGGYVLSEADHSARDVTLLATGSEVALALEAKHLLAKGGIRAAVVSLPCWELFAAQSAEYRAEVLGSAPRIGIEAAVAQGWERWLGERGIFLGMDGFGASAPAAKLYEHFGMSAARIAAAAQTLVGR